MRKICFANFLAAPALGRPVRERLNALMNLRRYRFYSRAFSALSPFDDPRLSLDILLLVNYFITQVPSELLDTLLDHDCRKKKIEKERLIPRCMQGTKIDP